MTFHLKQHEAANKGLARLILHEVIDAEKTLTSNDNEYDIVHDVRTHCKKIRALLRLARKDMGKKSYHRENVFFRDQARPLTELRDAAVRLKTLDTLEKNVFSNLYATFLADHKALRERVLRQNDAFHSIANAMQQAKRHMDDWNLEQKNWKPLQQGLRHTYRKGHRAFTIARQHPTDRHLHEWRKQSKYLWYELRVLKSVRPKHICAWSRKIGKWLGEDHDLAELHHILVRLHSHESNIKMLIRQIDRQRHHLQERAFHIGKRLYADSPRDFIGRFK